MEARSQATTSRKTAFLNSFFFYFLTNFLLRVLYFFVCLKAQASSGQFQNTQKTKLNQIKEVGLLEAFELACVEAGEKPWQHEHFMNSWIPYPITFTIENIMQEEDNQPSQPPRRQDRGSQIVGWIFQVLQDFSRFADRSSLVRPNSKNPMLH